MANLLLLIKKGANLLSLTFSNLNTYWPNTSIILTLPASLGSSTGLVFVRSKTATTVSIVILSLRKEKRINFYHTG